MASKELEEKVLTALDNVYQAVDMLENMNNFNIEELNGDVWKKIDKATNQLLTVLDTVKEETEG